MVFHFRLIPEKFNKKNFKKRQNTILGPPLAIFFLKIGPTRVFLENRAPLVFSLLKSYIYGKNQKKLTSHF